MAVVAGMVLNVNIVSGIWGRRCWVVVALSGLILCDMQPAFAQIAAPVPVPDLTQPEAAEEKQSVGEKTTLSADSAGFRVGSFIATTEIGLSETFDSNIFGVALSPTSDFVTRVNPTVSLASDWDNHAVALLAGGTFSEYAKNPNEDSEDAVFQANGRLTIEHGQYLAASAGYQLLHELRINPDFQAAEAAAGGLAEHQAPYRVQTGHLTYVYSPQRLGFALDGDIVAFRFSNETATNGLTVVNNNLNREDTTLTPRMSYELEPGYQAYLQDSFEWDHYDTPVDLENGGLRRGSRASVLAIGTEFRVFQLITGDIFIGYRSEHFDDPRVSALHGITVGGSALWNANDLTSLKLSLKRDLDATGVVGSGVVWTNEATVTVERELLRPLLLTGAASYAAAEYVGTSRNDTTYGLNLGVKWNLARNYTLDCTFNWLRRYSTVQLGDFSDQAAMIRLVANL